MEAAAGMDDRARRRRTCVMLLIVAGGGVLAAGLGRLVAGALSPAHAAHAALMIYAWGILLPAGAIVARYFKVTRDQDFPRETDNRFWWTWHRVLQTAGLLLATLGLATIWSISTAGGAGAMTAHGRLGLTALALGWLQVAGALLRGTMGGPTDTRLRGDHYDMTPRRRLFEALHKTGGWLTLALAVVALISGMVLADAPDLALAALGGLIGLHLAAVVHCACTGRWTDTYRAIWGHPAPRHGAQP